MNPQDIDVNAHSAPQIEALDRSRRRMLVAVPIATVASMLPWILRDALGAALPRALNTVLILVGLVGALSYVVFMMRFHRFQMRVHGDPELRARLDDERVLALRREAIYRGWIVLVVALGLGVGVVPFVELPDQAVLMTLLLLAVNAPIGFYLFLDRD